MNTNHTVPTTSVSTLPSITTSASQAAPVGAPPVVTLPAVPDGFVPIRGADLQGYRPMQSEIAATPDALAELQAFADYSALFGITAPPVDQLLHRLTIASEWTAVLSQASAWYQYARSQHGVAWKDALALVQKLKAPFQLATAANPVLLGHYPALARLLGASKAVSMRAVATRGRNKKNEAAKAQAGAAPAAARTPRVGESAS